MLVKVVRVWSDILAVKQSCHCFIYYNSDTVTTPARKTKNSHYFVNESVMSVKSTKSWWPICASVKQCLVACIKSGWPRINFKNAIIPETLMYTQECIPVGCVPAAH